MVRAREKAIQFGVDTLKLEGRLAVLAGATRGVVLCHPHPQYGGTMDNNVIVGVADALQADGMATLRFNFRGVEASEGRYQGGEGEAHDVQAAVDLLREQLPGAEIILAGYSFGAIVALMVGHDETPNVSRLVAIAPPVSMFDISFMRACTKPKLFVSGDLDPYCPLAALEQVFATLPGPKALVPIVGADHFFFGHEKSIGDAVAGFVAQESTKCLA